EVRRLVAARRVERAVVGDDADPVPVQFGVAADRLRAVVGLELEELRAVDETRDDFAHVEGFAEVDRNDAGELLRIEGGLGETARPGRACRIVPARETEPPD